MVYGHTLPLWGVGEHQKKEIVNKDEYCEQMLSHEKHHVSAHGTLWDCSDILSSSLTYAELLWCTVLW